MQNEDEPLYTIGKLAEQAGVTTRTVRFYLSEGLLPPPSALGRNAGYGKPHLDRLMLIREMKEALLPLSAIRDQLHKLTDMEVVALLAQAQVSMNDLALCEEVFEAQMMLDARRAVKTEIDSAADYIARVLERKPILDTPSPHVAMVSIGPVEAEQVAFQRRKAPEMAGEPWTRHRIAPGLELLVKEDEPGAKSAAEQIIRRFRRGRSQP